MSKHIAFFLAGALLAGAYRETILGRNARETSACPQP